MDDYNCHCESPPLSPPVGQLNLLHIITTCFIEIRFNINVLASSKEFFTGGTLRLLLQWDSCLNACGDFVSVAIPSCMRFFLRVSVVRDSYTDGTKGEPRAKEMQNLRYRGRYWKILEVVKTKIINLYLLKSRSI
jgi:hypothetical protein